MINRTVLFIAGLLTLGSPLVGDSGSPSTCPCQPTPHTTQPSPETNHPLRGRVEAIFVERSSLLVKHEEIPDVMAAMTMMFKVDPSDLDSVTVGDALTALMYRDAEGKWCLTDITVITADQ